MNYLNLNYYYFGLNRIEKFTLIRYAPGHRGGNLCVLEYLCYELWYAYRWLKECGVVEIITVEDKLTSALGIILRNKFIAIL